MSKTISITEERLRELLNLAQSQQRYEDTYVLNLTEAGGDKVRAAFELIKRDRKHGVEVSVNLKLNGDIIDFTFTSADNSND